MMEVEIPAGALAQALITVGRVTENRTGIPSLGRARMRATAAEGIRLDGTNMKVWLSVPVPGRVIADGDLLLDGMKPLRTMICAAPAGALATVKEANDRAVVSCGPICVEDGGIPVEDFPAPVRLGGIDGDPTTVAITAGDLAAMLSVVGHAISDEETRYYLNGICVSTEGDVLHMVATDGRRLMSTDMQAGIAGPPLAGVIVPKQVCRMLRDMLPQMPRDQQTLMTFAPSLMRMEVEAERWRISARMIDGTFPAWRKVLPKDDTPRAPLVVRDGAALGAILGAMTAGRKKSQPAKLVPVNGRLEIHVTDDRFDQKVRVKVGGDVAVWFAPEGDPGTFAQVRYLADICSALPGGFELRAMTDPTGPVEIRAGRSLGALMPMKGR